MGGGREGKGQESDRGSELMNWVLGFYADLRGPQNAHCDPQLVVIWAPYILGEVCFRVCTLEPGGLCRGFSLVSPLG